jgi:hypothetical protein
MKNFFLVNKKGESSNFTLDEFVRIVLAVIGLLIIGYLAYNLFFVNPSNEKAKGTFNNIISVEIDKINNGGEANLEGVFIPNPSDWEIVGFVEGEKPNQCVGESCVCLCDISGWDSQEAIIKKCDEKGFCKIVEDLVPFEIIKIPSGGFNLLIKKTIMGFQIGGESAFEEELFCAEDSVDALYNLITNLWGFDVRDSAEVQISKPEGWEILSFIDEDRPTKCNNNPCICVCNVNSEDSKMIQMEKCDCLGVCKNVENLFWFPNINIFSSGTLVKANKKEGGIEINVG